MYVTTCAIACIALHKSNEKVINVSSFGLHSSWCSVAIYIDSEAARRGGNNTHNITQVIIARIFRRLPGSRYATVASVPLDPSCVWSVTTTGPSAAPDGDSRTRLSTKAAKRIDIPDTTNWATEEQREASSDWWFYQDKTSDEVTNCFIIIIIIIIDSIVHLFADRGVHHLIQTSTLYAWWDNRYSTSSCSY